MWCDKVGQGLVGYGYGQPKITIQGEVRRGMVRHGMIWWGWARLGMVRYGREVRKSENNQC